MATELAIAVDSSAMVPMHLLQLASQMEKTAKAFRASLPPSMQEAARQAQKIEGSMKRARKSSKGMTADFKQSALQFARMGDLQLRTVTKLKNALAAMAVGGALGVAAGAGAYRLMSFHDQRNLQKAALTGVIQRQVEGYADYGRARGATPAFMDYFRKRAAVTPGTDTEFMTAFNAVARQARGNMQVSKAADIVTGLLTFGNREGSQGRESILRDITQAFTQGVSAADTPLLFQLLQAGGYNLPQIQGWRKEEGGGEKLWDAITNSFPAVAEEMKANAESFEASVSTFQSIAGNILYRATQPFVERTKGGLKNLLDIFSANNGKITEVAEGFARSLSTIFRVTVLLAPVVGALGAAMTALLSVLVLLGSVIGGIVYGGPLLGAALATILLFMSSVHFWALALASAFAGLAAVGAVYNIVQTEGALESFGRVFEQFMYMLDASMGTLGFLTTKTFEWMATWLPSGETILKGIEDASFAAADGLSQMLVMLETLPAVLDWVTGRGYKAIGQTGWGAGKLMQSVPGANTATKILNYSGRFGLLGPVGFLGWKVDPDAYDSSAQSLVSAGGNLMVDGHRRMKGASGDILEAYTEALKRHQNRRAAGYRYGDGESSPLADVGNDLLKNIKDFLSGAGKGGARVVVEHVEIRTENMDDPQRFFLAMQHMQEQMERKPLTGTPGFLSYSF